MHIVDGEVLEINNRSGTFRQGKEVLDQVASDLRVPRNRIVPWSFKKHNHEQYTAGLRSFFKNDDLYKRIDNLKLQTVKMFDIKNTSFEQLDSKIQQDMIESLTKGDMERAEQIKDIMDTYNFFINNPEPEQAFSNILMRNNPIEKNREILHQMFDEYQKYLLEQ